MCAPASSCSAFELDRALALLGCVLQERACELDGRLQPAGIAGQLRERLAGVERQRPKASRLGDALRASQQLGRAFELPRDGTRIAEVDEGGRLPEAAARVTREHKCLLGERERALDRRLRALRMCVLGAAYRADQAGDGVVEGGEDGFGVADLACQLERECHRRDLVCEVSGVSAGGAGAVVGPRERERVLGLRGKLDAARGVLERLLGESDLMVGEHDRVERAGCAEQLAHSIEQADRAVERRNACLVAPQSQLVKTLECECASLQFGVIGALGERERILRLTQPERMLTTTS